MARDSRRLRYTRAFLVGRWTLVTIFSAWSGIGEIGDLLAREAGPIAVFTEVARTVGATVLLALGQLSHDAPKSALVSGEGCLQVA